MNVYSKNPQRTLRHLAVIVAAVALAGNGALGAATCNQLASLTVAPLISATAHHGGLLQNAAKHPPQAALAISSEAHHHLLAHTSGRCVFCLLNAPRPQAGLYPTPHISSPLNFLISIKNTPIPRGKAYLLPPTRAPPIV